MISSKTFNRIAVGVSLGIGCLLLWAACLKALYPADARGFVRAVAPGLPAGMIIGLVSVLEWCAGVLLLWGFRRQLLLCVVALVLIVFALATWYARTQGFIGRCGCLGSFGDSSVGSVFARNGLLAVTCGVAALTMSSRVRVATSHETETEP